MAPEGWRAVGAELGAMAQRLQEQGLALGYHNHHWELVAFPDGRTPLELLFDGAKGSPLTFEADLAWLVRGGVDPLAWLDWYRDRLRAVHVKDIAPAGENVDEDGWCDVGAGTLDWPTLWRESLGTRCQVDGPGARQAQGSAAFRPGRPRLPPPARGLRASNHGAGQARHRRLRQHQRRLSHRRRALASGCGEIGRGHDTRSGGEEGPAVRRGGGSVRAHARGPRDRDRHQPHGTSGSCRGEPAGDRGRQARLLGKALRRDLRRGPRADIRRARQGRAAGLSTRHLLRRRPPGRPLRHRRGADRARGRRCGVLRRPGHGELAPQPFLLLQARWRAGPRHRLLPDHPAGELPRARWPA